ncbi:MAG: hypothetical protein JRN67_01590 [Nitrososphaerota archaeon]|nr:hypothetical protein [Nitrososphaerota archaeon]
MASIQDLIKGRPHRPPGRFNLFSFSLFSLLCLGTTIELGRWPLFAVLFVLDALGTLAAIDLVISADRAFFFLVTLLLTLLTFPLNIFSLSLEVLSLVAALDFSFLLRKVDGTGVEVSVITNRLKSYAYTMFPAFLLTYLFLYFYSVNPQFTLLEAALALGLGTVGIFVSVYAIIRFLLSIDRRI